MGKAAKPSVPAILWLYGVAKKGTNFNNTDDEFDYDNDIYDDTNRNQKTNTNKSDIKNELVFWKR